MHHIYTSQSLILKRQPLETSASFYILTKDLGLIRARAQGVRRQESRLKGTLQEFSLATIAYVRAKSGWKITTAIPEKNLYYELKDKTTQAIVVHIANVLIRFISGEESNATMFTTVTTGFASMIEGHVDPLVVEILILARVLSLLGYVAKTPDTEVLFEDLTDFSPPLITTALGVKSVLVQAINKAFQESHL